MVFAMTSVENVRRGGGVVALVILAGGTLAPRVAVALPSFARQTDQACTACHIGGFGPQLTPYGRQFKMQGYTESAGNTWIPPLSVMDIGSFTRTKKSQPDRPADGFSRNDNFNNDELSMFYAGRIYGDLGAFIQGTRSGDSGDFTLDNADIRLAHTFELKDDTLTLGVSANNNPGSQDSWNTLPAWRFPYTSSQLAPTPSAAPVIDEAFGQQVAGATAYALWNKNWYAEAGAFASLGKNSLQATGISTSGLDELDGAAPYWRLAFQQDKRSWNWQIGTYGFLADVYPGRNKADGANHYVDVGVDATYQFLGTRKHIFTANVANTYESQDLSAAKNAGDADNKNNYLNETNVNVSYNYDQSYGLTVGFFNIFGSRDRGLYAPGALDGSRKGRPDSNGFVLQADWTPFGKDDSWLSPWLNLRLGIQYTAYLTYNGSSSDYDGAGRDAADNNTLFVFGWLAF